MQIDYDLALKYYPKKIIDTMYFLRSIALEIDENPFKIDQCLKNKKVIDLSIDRESSCLERTKLLEALSYADAGVLLACPGPSLSGLMLRELGNEEQKTLFFDYIEKNQAPTFLAVTEPEKGSDAARLQTSISKVNANEYEINGQKWLVGHGADAPIGVLIARTNSGPLGMTAVLLTPEIISENSSDAIEVTNDESVGLETNYFESKTENKKHQISESNQVKQRIFREHLNTVGLKGAMLSRLAFNQFKINESQLLGLHLSPIKRGMMALMKTFNRMRPGVAAFALGHAQAVIDYTKTNLKLTTIYSNEISSIDEEIMLTRLMLYKSAKRIDENPFDTSAASIAKAKATEVAEKTTLFAVDAFDKEIFHHPLLMKWYRDVYGYEYMEGTTYIHLKNVFQSYITSLSHGRRC